MRTLDALAAQNVGRDRFEVVVADNGSTDDTASVLEAFSQRPDACVIRYLHVAVAGKSRAVNRALGDARGDIVALTDDDVRPNRSWLAYVAHAFDDPGVDFVAGRTLPEWEAEPPRWISPALFGVLAISDGGALRLPIRRGVNTHIMPIGANMAVRTRVIRQIGGLREDLGKLEGTLRTGEDHELFLRLLHHGCRGLYEPEAVVRHWVPRARLNPAYFRRWLYQNGRDVARLQAAFPARGRRMLGVPLYLWREAVGMTWRLVKSVAGREVSQAFAASLRLIWLAGFTRETWFTPKRDRRALAQPSETGKGIAGVIGW
jgi:glycosyltransferase involved in cell wall biosynthesis